MSVALLRIRPLLILVLLLTGFSSPAVGEAPYAGRPVRAVLEELQSPGLNLIYNDELVPASLRVLREPGARSGPALVNEILQPHGLATRSIGPGTWAIVTGKTPPPATAGT
ncbi:MAG: hypothetical protein OEV14_05955, partial [Gammaproteobacteria bacterium]|nr:hypothetical protein [Gammaproteobacteria bacterium]